MNTPLTDRVWVSGPLGLHWVVDSGGKLICLQTCSEITVTSAPVSIWNSITLSFNCRVTAQGFAGSLSCVSTAPRNTSWLESVWACTPPTFAGDLHTAGSTLAWSIFCRLHPLPGNVPDHGLETSHTWNTRCCPHTGSG